MTEKLLQFIWQFQYFNRSNLTTEGGESIDIMSPGTLNTNQGPDFLNARIRIGSTILAGSVELHLKTKQWNEHYHSEDPNYNNVILHVVYQHDPHFVPQLPTLELQSRISYVFLERYQKLMDAPASIACSGSIHLVKELTWVSWKERLVAERLSRKAQQVDLYLKATTNHWEESFWWLLARYFGSKVNADAFEAIARSVPLSLLARHKNQIHQLEALLLGQAGMLEGTFSEGYSILLQREYQFLRKKYQLQPVGIPVHFLRMRPGNFPSLRLAQLAMLISQSSHLLSYIKECGQLSDIRNFFNVAPNDYWLYHYRLDHPGPYKLKKLGAEMIDLLIINTVVPILYAYGIFFQEERYCAKAIRWLEETDAEQNNIVKGFKPYVPPVHTAFDSQALIELKTQYCDPKRCLQCSIGHAIFSAEQ